MKINNLKINGFGKLKNKEIELSDGINIIYGENESGKSSILKFISSILYGTSKNKNGKEISDFDKYKPWKTEEFSGKIDYTLKNGEKFEVYREFKKKNPIIYNSNKEDISKTFKIDKNKGIDFFTEQTGIDEETFLNTAITEQEGIKLSTSSQNSIIQKISNFVSTGDDNISFKKSMDKLNKRQLEEIGTERSSQKPINIVNNKIYKLLEEKRNLETYKDSIYDNSIEKEQLKLEEQDEMIKKELLNEIRLKLDNNRVKSAEINFNKNLENDYVQKIKELNYKVCNDKAEESLEEVHSKNYYILILVFIIAFIILMIFNPYKLINFVILLPVIYILYRKNKEEKKIKEKFKNRNIEKEKIINEIEVLNRNKKEQTELVEEKEKKFSIELEKENKVLTEKYIKYLDLGYIEDVLSKDYNDILKEIQNKENRLNTIKFKLHTMENNEREIANKLDSLSMIEEEIRDAEEEKQELLSINKSFNIAKECLEKANKLVKESISPRFTDNLCDIISKISNNRYTNIVLSDTDGLDVEIENGSYVPVSRLSVGTIDQMYISLRLSVLEEITDENMPIIFDEAFAYFDNERLKNILKYLSINFKNNQIIIFTCSKREEEVLDELGLDYKIQNIS